jgi:hypothetical protein
MSRIRWALVAALLLCFAPASAAQAAFAPGNDVVANAEQLSADSFGMDAAGNSVVAWTQQQSFLTPQEVKARRLDAGGGLGPTIDLSPGEVGFQPALAVTAGGRAFAVWRVSEGPEPSTLKGRWIEPDGSLGPLLTLLVGEPGVDPVEVQAVADSAGVVTVAWRNQSNNVLEMRRVQPDGGLSAIVEDASGGSGVSSPHIAALPSGATVAVWSSSGIDANVIPADLSQPVGTPFPLSEPGLVGNPQIAVDGAGNGLVVWRTELEDEATFVVSGRRLSPSGGPVGAELEIDPGQTGFVGTQVNVSAGSAGRFMVTWNRQDAEGDSVVYARSVDSAGAFGGPGQPLSSGELSGSAQRSELLDQGVAPVVWDTNAGAGRYTLGRTVNPFAVATSAIQELATGESRSVAAVSAPAAGVAAFLVEYPTSETVFAAAVRRFLVPPTCSDSTATVAQGAATRLPIACTGPAIEGGQVLEQPQHGTVAAFDPATHSFTYTSSPDYEGGDSFTYLTSNDGGSSTPVRLTIAVKDITKPKIDSLRLQKKVAKKRPAGGSKASKAPKSSYRFHLAFSELATAAVTVERATPGVRKGKACKPRTAGARGKPCTLYRRIGKLSSKVASRSVAIAVTGGLKAKLDAGGRFRASAIATDRAGNESTVRRLGFRVAAR